MTGVLLGLLDLRPDAVPDAWIGPGNGPAGKRAFGGQFIAAALTAACRTVPEGVMPTSLHVQFLRGGDAAEPVTYQVERVLDRRSAMSRRVVGRQRGSLVVTATAGFATPAAGPEHGRRRSPPGDPTQLARTGPAGPAPAMPLDEIDIRISDHGAGEGFLRRFWWRTTVPLPDDPLVHACVASFVTDVYMMDPALRVHGHSMSDRSHRTWTTDASTWFHRRIRADHWNLLESTSPAAAQGRGVVTGSLVDAEGAVAATLVHEGLVAAR